MSRTMRMRDSASRAARGWTMHRPRLRAVLFTLLGCVLAPATIFAQGMDLRQAAGVPLPAADLPAGTVSVRVVRGSFANNLAGETVVFTVDGQSRSVTTDAAGRAQISDLPQGARVQATATVGTERLESQEITIGGSGIRFVLVASGGDEASAAPATPVPGSVVIDSGSRIVIDYSNELLNVYYVIHVVN